MTTAQDLFAQGSHAFAEDDYEEALNFYSQAIEVNGTHAEIFLKRYVPDTVYIKMRLLVVFSL